MIPTPEQRPDLYDDYDGLPEGKKTAITTPPDIQKLINEKAAGSKNKPAPEAGPEETKPA